MSCSVKVVSPQKGGGFGCGMETGGTEGIPAVAEASLGSVSTKTQEAPDFLAIATQMSVILRRSPVSSGVCGEAVCPRPDSTTVLPLRSGSSLASMLSARSSGSARSKPSWRKSILPAVDSPESTSTTLPPSPAESAALSSAARTSTSGALAFSLSPAVFRTPSMYFFSALSLALLFLVEVTKWELATCLGRPSTGINEIGLPASAVRSSSCSPASGSFGAGELDRTPIARASGRSGCSAQRPATSGPEPESWPQPAARLAVTQVTAVTASNDIRDMDVSSFLRGSVFIAVRVVRVRGEWIDEVRVPPVVRALVVLEQRVGHRRVGGVPGEQHARALLAALAQREPGSELRAVPPGGGLQQVGLPPLLRLGRGQLSAGGGESLTSPPVGVPPGPEAAAQWVVRKEATDHRDHPGAQVQREEEHREQQGRRADRIRGTGVAGVQRAVAGG